MKIKSIYLEKVKNLDKIQLDFSPKLNILTGANGTGKSTILNCLILGINKRQIAKEITKTDVNKVLIKVSQENDPAEECTFENNNLVHSVVPDAQFPILAFNPKRNIGRELFEDSLQKILTQKDFGKYEREIASHFDNGVYNEILSINQILALKMKKIPANVTPQNYIEKVKDEFNVLVNTIFPEIKITSTEFTDLSNYRFVFQNHGRIVDVNDFSTGEKEVLTLIVNIDYYKDDFKILIIDEPEVHLNWSLESKLFETFLKFAQDKGKQIIVTTHSRVLIQYLEHPDVKLINLNLDKATNEVSVSSENLTDELEEIIGKVTTLDKYEKIVICEDALHKKVIDKVNEAKVTQGKIRIFPLGDKGAVKNFIVKGIDPFPAPVSFKDKFLGFCDSDNETPIGNARIKETSKYNIENYLLQSDVLFTLDQNKLKKFNTKEDLQSFLLQKITDLAGTTIATYDQTILDKTKIKKILRDVYEHLGYDNIDNFVNDYYTASSTSALFSEFVI